MIIAVHGTEYFKNGLTIFTGSGDTVCPDCGGKLIVHGTCRRKIKTHTAEKVYRLRVMECVRCRKTHRELPSGFIPYKRMDAKLISEIAEVSLADHMMLAESSTWQRIKMWVAWFLQYAQDLLCAKRDVASCLLIKQITGGLTSQLIYLMMLTVNSGNWIQHGFA